MTTPAPNHPPTYLEEVARRFPGDPHRQAGAIRSKVAELQRRGEALVSELRSIEAATPVLLGAAEALEAQVIPAPATSPAAA